MSDLRERIIATAYPLFVNRGVRDVSVAEILVASGATRGEFDDQFDSRDALASECLSRREREWTLGVVLAGARARGATPELQLLGIFEVFHDWFQRDDYEACTFINVLLEMGREHPLGRASILHLLHIRDIVATLAAEAELRDPDGFALSWHILMKGSIINAVEGDRDAALRAREMAEDLINRHRPASAEADLEWWMEHESAFPQAEPDVDGPGEAVGVGDGSLPYTDWNYEEA